MVISVVSSIWPPFPFLMSYISVFSHTRCLMPLCMIGGQRSVLKYISSFLKCFLLYSSYINIMLFWKVYLNIWKNINFFKLFKEIGLKIKKVVYPSRTGDLSKVRNDILFLKNEYIYYYLDLRRAICSIFVILHYFELSKNFIKLFNIFEKDSKYYHT